MIGYRFTEFIPESPDKFRFEQLLKLYLQILNITAGDVSEAINILNELDRKYGLTNDNYGVGDFIDELKQKGYIKENENDPNLLSMTAKSEQAIRRSALEEIFNKLKKSGKGNHVTPYSGTGDEKTADRRDYLFGDTLDQIDMTSSIKNAQIAHGINNFMLTENDLEVEEI